MARILHIITCLDTGGAEASLYRLIKHDRGSEFEHVVCSLKTEGSFGARLKGLGIAVHALGGRRALLVQQVARLIRSVGPDIVQGWMPHGNFAACAGRALSGARPPLIWSIHQALYNLSFEKRGTAAIIRLCALLSNFPRRIVYVSQLSATQHEALGFRTNRTIIPNGFDTDIFVPNPAARTAIRRSLGIPEQAPLIGLMGRYHPAKDHFNFIAAAKRIRASLPQAVFLLAGKNTDAQSLTDCIAEAGLLAHVRILGERKDMPALMAALDLLATSSITEAFPNVVGEAMACGVPCVVTDVGDSALIVGDTGRVVQPRDPQALADAILEILNSPQRAELGHRARARIAGEFSISSIVSKYRALYAGCLEGVQSCAA